MIDSENVELFENLLKMFVYITMAKSFMLQIHKIFLYWFFSQSTNKCR